MKKSFLLYLLLGTGISGITQANLLPSKEHVDAMGRVAIIEGNWKGTGWIQMGPQRHTVNQIETVQLKVNGTVLQIDGLGLDPADNKTVVHNAFGLITYDLAKKEYAMQAFRGDGGRVDAYLNLLSDDSFEWGFKHPVAGDMKYIITVKNNEWVETGEMSRDGKTWFKFIEMKLHKQ